MPKKYNLGKPSDMRRFQRDIQSIAMEKAVDAVQSRSYNVTCPHCHRPVTVMPGKHPCPLCRQEIDLILNIH